jgi:cytochrome c oxidase accessory protein FixG
MNLGACVDCSICVQVCPTGIDIRQGLQYECIGCAACIDGCDQVMDRMGYPRGLIRYSTERAMQHGWGWNAITRRVARPRVLAYSAALVAIAVAAGAALVSRAPLKMDVIRDRAALAREVEGGAIENVYRLQVMNTQERPRRFSLSVAGAPALGDLELVTDERMFRLPPLASRLITVRVRARPGDTHGVQPIEFILASPDDARPTTLREASRFIAP